MMTTVGNEAGPLVLSGNGLVTASPATEASKHVKNSSSLSLFGKDGFTFFDFLDILNPLHHIPVISTIYRSLTGDQIDPGSRIAGATVFGGPLGAALVSMDVAIQHKTGHDIAEHAATLFTGNIKSIRGNPDATRDIKVTVRSETVLPPTNKPSIDLDAPPSAGVAPKNSQLVPISSALSKFDAAGMTAIPFAKKRIGSQNNVSMYVAPTAPDLGILGQVRKLTSPRLTQNNLAEDFQKPSSLSPPVYPSYNLTPRLSTRGAEENNGTSDRTGKQWQKKRPKLEQFVNDAKNEIRNDWVIDAMLRGLGKYEAAAKLKGAPQKMSFSAIR